MKQSALLCDWTRLHQWEDQLHGNRLCHQEKSCHPSTPPYFSFLFTLITPLLYPITKPSVIFSLYLHTEKQTGTEKHSNSSWGYLKPGQFSSTIQTQKTPTYSLKISTLALKTLQRFQSYQNVTHSHSYQNTETDEDFPNTS